MLLIVLLLTAGLYAPVAGFAFLSYDDPILVTENPLVRNGLTVQGLGRIWMEVGPANLWHPLTWLSHMADSSLFGPDNPAGPHVINALLHIVGTAGLWMLMRCLCGGRVWLATGLVLLWALHPLRIQSVAWVSERKDVLSGLFFFWSWWSWERHRAEGRRSLPWGCWILFLAALLSKPSVLPLPFVILGLEFFRRRGACREEPVGEKGDPAWRCVIVWLLPMMILAAGGALLTIHFQRQGRMWEVVEIMPLSRRLLLMPEGLWWYVERFFLPLKDVLWVKPPPMEAPFWSFWTALGALLLGAWGLWIFGRRAWLAAAGALALLLLWLPVSGLVPLSYYFVADRYSYLIHSGILLCLAGLLSPAWTGSPSDGGPLRETRRPPWPVLALMAWALVLGGVSMKRLERWRSGGALFSAELAVNPGSLPATIHLGQTRLTEGKTAEALSLFREAMDLDKASGSAAFLAGQAAELMGDPAEAEKCYETAVARRLPDGKAWSRLASLKTGATPETAEASAREAAAAVLRDGVSGFPRDPLLRAQLGSVLQASQNAEEAARAYRQALSLDPDCVPALQGLAGLLLETGKPEDIPEARSHLERLLRLQPGNRALRALLNQLPAAPP